MRWPLLICVILFLAGCGPIEAGPKPTEAQFKEGIRGWILSNAKDPGSAQYRFGPIAGGPSVNQYWHMCVEINGKNSFGGYIGFEAYQFEWANGEIRYVYEDIGFGPPCSIPPDTPVTI